MARTHKPKMKKVTLDGLSKMITDRAPKVVRRMEVNAGGVTNDEEVQVEIRTFPVSWGIPMDELIFAKWFNSFIRLRIMPWDEMITTMSTYLPDARNIIHQGFVTKSQSEWLVMLDSDVLPPPDFLKRLMAHNLPMVGGWYRKKGAPFAPVVYDIYEGEGDKTIYKPRLEPGTGLEKVDGAGAGCWLMHRSVAVAIGERPYDMNGGGEDLQLCRKVIAAGFDIVIDWSVACAHVGVSYV